MGIVIIFNNKDPKPWAAVLQKKLPDISVEIYPDVQNKATIDFALCWKPQKNVLLEFPNLKVAQSVGASADNIINTQQIAEYMVVARIVDEQLAIDMFEYLLMGILNYLKNTNQYFQDKNQKIWQQKPYKTIANTTVCILGLGQIGAYVATKLNSLGFETKGWARTAKMIDNIATFQGQSGLKQALGGSDVLINLLPLTPATKNILCLDNMVQLNQDGYIINVGRGEHLVEEDLAYLIDSQHLAGALLDVFCQEPLPQNHLFWANDKIAITPHVASLTNVETASDCVVANFKKFQNKEQLSTIISIQNGY